MWPYPGDPGSVPPGSTATEWPISIHRPGDSRHAGPSVRRGPLPPPPHPFESSISFPDLPRVTDPHGHILSKMPRWWEGGITSSVLSANTARSPLHLPWGGGVLLHAGAGGRGRLASPEPRGSTSRPSCWPLLSRRQGSTQGQGPPPQDPAQLLPRPSRPCGGADPPHTSLTATAPLPKQALRPGSCPAGLSSAAHAAPSVQNTLALPPTPSTVPPQRHPAGPRVDASLPLAGGHVSSHPPQHGARLLSPLSLSAAWPGALGPALWQKSLD